MRIWQGFKKFLRWFAIIFLGLFLVANLFILVTGKFYLYKAVWYTYLHGQSGPGIYDRDYFYSREIPGVVKPDYWHEHEKFGKISLDKSILKEVEGFKTTSLLVIHQDKILFEKYWYEHDKDFLSNSFSMSKSFVSMLIGAAIGEGKIKSVDQKVSDFIPAYKEDDRKKLTVRHLLTMSAALDWSESGGNPLSDNAEAYYGWDLEGMIADVEMGGEPGKIFVYQSGATMILGKILEKATGMKLADYAEKKLWKPVGAENTAYWSLDREDGLEKAYCCFYATTRDFARLGRIMMNGGKWKCINFNEEYEIVSEEWVKSSIAPAGLKIEDGKTNKRYGYSWWLTEFDKHPVFYARGILGQYIICIPELDVIVVRTGHNRGEKNEEDHPMDIYVYMEAAKDLLEKL